MKRTRLFLLTIALSCFIGCDDSSSVESSQSSQTQAECGDNVCDKDESCESCEKDCGSCTTNGWCGDGTCDSDESCKSCEKDCKRCPVTEACGDGTCDSDESCSSCEKDCGKCPETSTCGDGTCSSDESCDSCPKDCGNCPQNSVCGDSKCDGDESCESCEKDCGKCSQPDNCGNGSCDNGETCESCEKDCGQCTQPDNCGNNKCDKGETLESCPKDCAVCGDKTCSDGETLESCPKDCAVCGDNTCSDGETCETCPVDCGRCEFCGDKICNNGETCSTCPQDCSNCCGDGKCDAKETYASCKQDCLEKHPCAKGCPDKMVFLYTGDAYYQYTSKDIDNFGLTHFVISDGQSKHWGTGDQNNHCPGYVKYVADAVDIIINSTNGENKRVWIGPPAIPGYDKANEMGYDAFYKTYTNLYKNFFDDAKISIGAEKWNKYVVGIYMGSEAVIGTMDDTSPETVKKNRHVQMFMEIAKKAHEPFTYNGKTWNAVKYLWSPYYHGTYSEAVKQTGLVINWTDIFDEVIIQPAYYFHTDNVTAYIPNLDALKETLWKQAMTWKKDAQGEFKIIGGTKKSKTRIGIQMEIDANYFDSSKPKMTAAYDAYVSYFSNKSHVIQGYDQDNYKFSYYFGGNSYKYKELQQKIREFHKVEPF